MRELSLHLLDIAENSVNAKAKNVRILVSEDSRTDRLRMEIVDDGVGMDAETAARVTDPFVTSRTTRKVGLGLPFLKMAAEGCNGYLTVHSRKGTGTRVDVEFQRSHIDRMPLGDLTGTILSLVIGYPKVHWTFTYRGNDREFIFDDTTVKDELDGIPLSEPTVIQFLREMISEGIQANQPVDETAFTTTSDHEQPTL
ncbi:ATP-binding protein [Longilinea arvoryzae]|uniref:ATP-binding protein n=1 Tax=Longilinea arvoryzae TaxID=360412 RepID=UPI00094616C0|nr:ATP-binding protein [Longilinea arvoryzae]